MRIEEPGNYARATVACRDTPLEAHPADTIPIDPRRHNLPTEPAMRTRVTPPLHLLGLNRSALLWQDQSTGPVSSIPNPLVSLATSFLGRELKTSTRMKVIREITWSAKPTVVERPNGARSVP